MWKFCSADQGLRPDAVLVTHLMVLGPFGSHSHALSDDFGHFFAKDKRIVVNYQGYSRDVAGLVFGHTGADRTRIEGYREEGSTVTPFDMMLRNHVSRYHVAMRAVRGATFVNEREALRAMELSSELQSKIKQAQSIIYATGAGMSFSILSVHWFESSFIPIDPEGTYDVPKFT